MKWIFSKLKPDEVTGLLSFYGRIKSSSVQKMQKFLYDKVFSEDPNLRDERYSYMDTGGYRSWGYSIRMSHGFFSVKWDGSRIHAWYTPNKDVPESV